MEFLEAKLSKRKYFGTWSHCCIDGWARRRSWWLSAENWSWIWLGACNKNVVRNALKRESQNQGDWTHRGESTHRRREARDGHGGERSDAVRGILVRGSSKVVRRLGGDNSPQILFSNLKKVTCRCRLCLITTCCGAGGESECGESTGEWSCQSEG